MILVQNHQPRLNGSKLSFLYLLILILALGACKSTQVAVDKKPVKKPIPTKKETIPVDTVRWTVNTDEKGDNSIEDPVVKNDFSNISRLDIILPVRASTTSLAVGEQVGNSSQESMIHYIQGLKIALNQSQELDEIRILDSDRNESKLGMLLPTVKRDGKTMVFGGAGKKEIEQIATYAESHDIIYASPWQTNSSFLLDNQTYVQLNPGFSAHANAILDHALAEFDADDIILFGSQKELTRCDEINRLYLEKTKSDTDLERLTFSDIDELSEMDLEHLRIDQDSAIREEQIVMIIPIARNFNLIQAMIRALQLNELTHRVTIYGVTNWYNDKLIPLMDNMDIRLSSPFFFNLDQHYYAFEENFYQSTGILPNRKGFEGYHHGLLLLETINAINKKKGNLNGLHVESLATQLNLLGTNRIKYPGQIEDFENPPYFENNHLFILGFDENKYFIQP